MALQKVTFYPKDGSRELAATIIKDAGDGWYDLAVDNVDVADGTPHRHFEVRSRLAGTRDLDRRGLFSPGAPPERIVAGGGPEGDPRAWADLQAAGVPAARVTAPMNTAAQHQQAQYARLADPPRVNAVGTHDNASVMAWHMRCPGCTYEAKDKDDLALHLKIHERSWAEMRRGQALAHAQRAPGKVFTREQVLMSLRAIQASKGGIAEAITAFEFLE